MPNDLFESADLFGNDDNLQPGGFRYAPDVVSAEEEQDLVQQIAELPFKEFEFQGFLGKRRVVSYGWHYDFNGGGFKPTDPIPAFLLPLRERAAKFAELPAEALAQALLLEYTAGAAIGWHKDRPVFNDVVGISRFLRAPFAFGGKSERDGSDIPWLQHHARSTCCAAPHEANGSTASRVSTR